MEIASSRRFALTESAFWGRFTTGGDRGQEMPLEHLFIRRFFRKVAVFE